MVPRPQTITTYNKCIDAVDRSDQILATNNVLRECMRSWKTLLTNLKTRHCLTYQGHCFNSAMNHTIPFRKLLGGQFGVSMKKRHFGVGIISELINRGSVQGKGSLLRRYVQFSLHAAPVKHTN